MTVRLLARPPRVPPARVEQGEIVLPEPGVDAGRGARRGLSAAGRSRCAGRRRGNPAPMGFREHVALQISNGTVVVDAGDEHLNPRGTVHGGLLATMLDTAMGNAVTEVGGERPVTVALTVTYLEPGRAGRLEATARVRKRGKRLLIVEGEVTQDGDVLADALGTFSVPAS